MPESKRRKVDVLRQQVIDLDGPGTVLRDFESLLEFVGPEGLRSTGKYHLLPLDRLAELDEKMTRPLRPRLVRPQQRSYPHLNGLYLLLRATGLGVPKGVGKKSGMLVLDPAVLDSWRTLNWTERYFNLLEAWLCRGRAEVLGERGGGWFRIMLGGARDAWACVPKQGLTVRKDAPRDHLLYGPLASCAVALLELFGFLDIDRGEPAEGENWRIQAARRTAFGEALLDLIFGQGLEAVLDAEDSPDFGLWQPLLQPFFPEWRNNLQLPEPTYRDGVYYFKVKLGRPWRRIAIPADRDLDDLARWIIKAFRFDGDHLYSFGFCARDGSQVSVEHPYVGDAREHTDEYSVGCLPLEEGQSMEFVYDFGADWRFDVTLEKIAPPNPRMTKPRIVESHGEAPAEYEEGEEDEEFEW